MVEALGRHVSGQPAWRQHPTVSTSGRTSPPRSNASSSSTRAAWSSKPPLRPLKPRRSSRSRMARWRSAARPATPLIHEMLAQGAGFRQIARHLGWNHRTVSLSAHAATWQETMIVPKTRASLLDRFKPYLTERIEGGCLSRPRCCIARSSRRDSPVVTASSVPSSSSTGHDQTHERSRSRCRHGRSPAGFADTPTPRHPDTPTPRHPDTPTPRQPHRPRHHAPDHAPRYLPRTTDRRRAGAFLRRDHDPATRSPPR